MSRPIPRSPAKWLDEIRLAFDDARETVPFAELAGTAMTEADLFHLAPLVCLKFRGVDPQDEKLRKRVTEGALTAYVANSGPDGPAGDLKLRPKLGFALCYITSHLVLDLLDERQAKTLLRHCERHLEEDE